MPSVSFIDFGDLYNRLLDIFNVLMSFGTFVFKMLTEEIHFGEHTFSLFGILFGLGFSAWILWKALPLT